MERIFPSVPGHAEGPVLRLMRGFDWALTPLGAPRDWPQPLRTLMGVMMGSNQPMFVAWGTELSILYNDRYAELLADKHPSGLGRPLYEVWHEIREQLAPIVERTLAGESVQMDDIGFTLLRKGYPEEAHFAFSYNPVRDEEGAVAGFFCACQEITTQVLSDRRLRESEARARAEAERVQLALDAGAIIGTWVWDLLADRFTVVEKFALAFGLDPVLAREGLGLEQVVETVHPEDLPDLRAAIAEVIARGGPYAHRYRVRRQDGLYYWIEANGRVDLGPDGRALRFPGVLLDIEERRRTEERLREANRRLDAILDNTREAVFLMDERHRCVYANAAAERLTGYRFEELQGRLLHDIVHHSRPDGSPYPIEDCPIGHASSERRQVGGEETFVARDGSFYPVAFTASPVLDDEGRVVGTVIEARNIADEKAAEAERQRAETALADAMTDLETTFDAAPVAIWIARDPEARFIDGNRASRELLRVPGEDANMSKSGDGAGESLSHFRVVTPDGRELAPEDLPVQRAARGEVVRDYEEKLVFEDGTEVSIVGNAVPILAPDGTPRGSVAAFVDVTARRQTEAALRESEERFRNMADHAPVMMWVTRPDGYCVYLNREWYEFTGQTPEEAVGLGWLEATHPDDRADSERVFLDANARQVPFRLEYRLRRADGSWRWAIDAAAPRFGAEGEFLGYIGSVIDIHERRAAEDRLRTLTDTVPAFVWFGAPDGAIQHLNDRWYEYTGQTREEAMPHGWTDAVHPEDRERVRAAWAEAMATGTPYEVECRYRRADGVHRWHMARAEPVRDPLGLISGWVGSSTDIDDRVRVESMLREFNELLEARVAAAVAEREQAEEQLRQSQKMEAVGQLTGGIAHDFNNMLAAVMGSLDLLGRRIGEGDARARRYVDAATEGARRAATLTQRLLAFSRQQPLRPEAIDLNRLVRGMSDLLERSLGAGVRLETVLSGGLWKAHADPNQLESVILNLALNARDAMPEGGRLTIETVNAHLDSHYSAEHLGVPPGQYVQIAVTDTGHGMTPEVVARAFDPFYTTKPVGQGTGLGLSQVYGFVRQSGGHVKIYSEADRGTTVKIYLPRLLGPQAEEEAEVRRHDLPRGEAQEVVLVVEDEAVVRQFTVDALSDLGYRVLEAEGAAAALRLLDAHPEVQLLFTDVVMPDTDGRRLANEALRRRPDLKVLFTTGYTRNAVVHNGVLDPGVHLLGKPFTVEELAEKMREVLDEIPARA